MKRWFISLAIAGYLTALSWGVMSHAFGFKKYSHPIMYYLVWDMYGGWSAFESRLYVIGEGQSGEYYQLAPAPWEGPQPFGDVDRISYDYYAMRSWKFAANTLRHTEHEPMTRVFVVEESWPKQFNMPDYVWEKRFQEPKDPRHYYNLRSVYSPDGKLVYSYPDWQTRLASNAVMSNPRLQEEARGSKPLFTFDRAGSMQPQRVNSSEGLQPLAN